MEKKLWSSLDIQKIFRFEERGMSPNLILNAEELCKIPESQIIQRGRQKIRNWQIEDLPEIGSNFGFLKKPNSQHVICVYIAKGGVLKTTLTYCLARILALNGIKTLIVGLDIQCSITELALPEREIASLEEADDPYLGLYHFLFENAPLDDVIRKTSLPTLDVLPETVELNVLEKKLRYEMRREYVLQDRLMPHLGVYDVVIFDNSPSWNQLIENALVVSNTVLSPAGCDLGTYRTLQINLGSLREFQESMKINWDNFLIVPTLLERTKLSQQIYEAYLKQYGDIVLPKSIRRAVKGQEALVLKQSPIEYDPASALAKEYFEVTKSIWDDVLGIEAETLADELKTKKNATEKMKSEVLNGIRI